MTDGRAMTDVRANMPSQDNGAAPAAVLIGPPGSGKSTVGKALAGLLGVAFRDADAEIEVRSGKPIADIFVEDGEEHFRALERAEVARGLAEHRGVLALGGGAVMDTDTRSLLAGHRVVYLEAAFPVVVKRVGLSQARPLLAINPRARMKQLLDERLPVYAELATVTVNTDHRTPDEVAEAVAEELGRPS